MTACGGWHALPTTTCGHCPPHSHIPLPMCLLHSLCGCGHVSMCCVVCMCACARVHVSKCWPTIAFLCAACSIKLNLKHLSCCPGGNRSHRTSRQCGCKRRPTTPSKHSQTCTHGVKLGHCTCFCKSRSKTKCLWMTSMWCAREDCPICWQRFVSPLVACACALKAVSCRR